MAFLVGSQSEPQNRLKAKRNPKPIPRMILSIRAEDHLSHFQFSPIAAIGPVSTAPISLLDPNLLYSPPSSKLQAHMLFLSDSFALSGAPAFLFLQLFLNSSYCSHASSHGIGPNLGEHYCVVVKDHIPHHILSFITAPCSFPFPADICD